MTGERIKNDRKQKTTQHFGKKLNTTGTVARDKSFEVCGDFVLSLMTGPRPVVEVVFNGLWPRGLRHGSIGVEQAFVGKGLVLFGPVGQRAFAHSIHPLERSWKLCAAW